MNTPNNKRKRQSREQMEAVFIRLLQERELDHITVTDICKGAGLNRTTFYANYTDIYALADAIRDRLELDLYDQYQGKATRQLEEGDYLTLFRHIADNQIFYKTYFKLGYDNNYKIITYDEELARRDFGDRHLRYHIEFFKSGITRIIKLWLDGGCQESPEEMVEILQSEYRGRG